MVTISKFMIPIDNRYFEDYQPGSTYEFGSIMVRRDEIIDFGKRYDPQAFDSGLEAAHEAREGVLVASGWLIASLGMRLLVDHYISHSAALGSPGVNNLRWLKPVHPGDKLSIRVTVLNSRPLRSKPGKGIVRSFIQVLNQNREVVASWTASTILLCKGNPQSS